MDCMYYAGAGWHGATRPAHSTCKADSSVHIGVNAHSIHIMKPPIDAIALVHGSSFNHYPLASKWMISTSKSSTIFLGPGSRPLSLANLAMLTFVVALS